MKSEKNRTFKIQNPTKSNLLTFSPRTLNLHPKRGHRNLDFMRSRPITDRPITNSAYDKLGLHYENITFLLSYKINHVSMRVCVLKEYLGSKNEFFLLTTHANKHTHTHTHIILSVYRAKLFCIQKE